MNSVRRLQNSVIYIYWVRSYKNLASEWDWGVWHVSINLDWHLEWNTPGSPRRYAGIFGGLLSKHLRYQAFTFFEAESGIRSKVESKAGREPNRPIRKSNRLTKKKKFHIPCATLNSYLDWLMWCNAALATNLLTKKRCRGNSICRTLFQTKRVCFTQTLYQHQSALPYMGCCTLSSCSSIKGPLILGPTISQTKAYICIVHDVVVVVVYVVVYYAPKMKSGRPIKLRIIKH